MNDSTIQLLNRMHGGDREALGVLLQRNLPAIRAMVRGKLGAALRKKEQTEDIVQQTMVEFLRYGPRFTIENEVVFRALMGKIALNVLRGRADWYQALRRKAARERPLSDSVIDLEPVDSSVPTPDSDLQRQERDGFVRLALELLEPEDRDVLVLREIEELPFSAIGEQLGISPDAAKMRYYRALPRLAETYRSLQCGGISNLVL